MGVVIIIVLAIISGATIYAIFGEQLSESGQVLLDDAAERARIDLMSMKFAFLDEPVGEDVCNNGLGSSQRSVFPGKCDVASNNYQYSSKINDCCCCNVTSHMFDFRQNYAYKNIEIAFEPADKNNPITVDVFYSLYSDPAMFKNIPECVGQTFEPWQLTTIDKYGRKGYKLSCYVRENVPLEDAQFRYIKLSSQGSKAIDYAKAEVYPAIRICELDHNMDSLEPGKGYWVYSALLNAENVTINDWDYGDPIAIIEADPQSAYTNQTITFDGSKSFSPHGTIPSGNYNWDFGDGDTANGPSVTHEYDLEGMYRVTLTISDGSDTGKSSTYVTVMNQYPVVNSTFYYEGFYWEGKYGP